VIMLAQQQGLSDADARSREPLLAALTGFLLLGTLLYVLQSAYKPDLDRWVSRTQAYLDRIGALRKRAEDRTDPPSAEEVESLAKAIEQFRYAYERWWRGLPPQHADQEAELSRDLDRPFPRGGERLTAALIDVRDARYDPKNRESAPTYLAAVEEKVRKLRDEG